MHGSFDHSAVLNRKARGSVRLGRIARLLERRLFFIRALRLLFFASIVVLPVCTFYFWAARTEPILLATLPGLLAFGLALFASRRAEKSLQACRAQMALNEDARARLLPGWDTQSSLHSRPSTTLGQSAEQAADELTHPYAGDLELFGSFSVFRLLDRTSTGGGSRHLAGRLAAICNPDTLEQNQEPGTFTEQRRALEELARARVFTERFRRAGKVLSADDAVAGLNTQRVRALAQVKLPPMPGLLPWVSRALSLCTVGSYIAFSMGFGQAYFLLSLPLQVLAFIGAHFYARQTSRTLGAMADDLVGYEQLFGAAAALKPRSSLLQELSVLGHAPFRTLRQLSWIASAFSLRRNPIAHAAAGVLFGYEIELLHRAARVLGPEQKNIDTWLTDMDRLDSLLCVAQYRADRPQYIQPVMLEFDDAAMVRAEALQHPLFDPHPEGHETVGNSFELAATAPIWVVSGSNMSGKSTFLRTVGTSLVMARLGATLPARLFAFQDLALVTSMQQRDDLRRSVSLFYAEVKRVKMIIEHANQHGKRLVFLIDEMLRGTNSHERQVAVRGVIRILHSAGSCGLVTTHDLELLQELCAKPWIACYHFQEVVTDGQMSFDYLLRQGPVRTSNALRILEQEGIAVIQSGAESHGEPA